VIDAAALWSAGLSNVIPVYGVTGLTEEIMARLVECRVRRTPCNVLDQTGSLANIKRHDYLPFGEELVAPTSGRSAAQGYSGGDAVRQQFTGYERDTEAGLDYAQARYFSSIQGRFTSVDPLAASTAPSNPQSWNRYGYSHNNPLRFADPSGLVPNDYYTSRDGTIIVYEKSGDIDYFYVESNTQAGQFDYVTSAQRNANGLVQFPANGTGFARYGQIDAGGMDPATGENVGTGDHFLQPVVAAALFGVTSELSSDNSFTVSLGDMSSSNGSDPWQAGGQHHSGHGHRGNRVGLDIDFRYLYGNGQSFQSQTATTDQQFSRQNNQTVYDRAASFGFTTNYHGTNGPAMNNATPARGHNDHGHLGFNQNNARIVRYRESSPGNWNRVP
jgi:RHS repeat-associated protein